MVVLHDFRTKLKLRDIQTPDPLSLFTVCLEQKAHVCFFRGALSSVTSSPRRFALKTFS